MASHLSVEEREVIAQMHRAGKLQTQIAKRLGRSKSTISRELRRNCSRNGYWAMAAQRKADRRRSKRRWVAKMERPEVRRCVQQRLRWRWSPDEIAGRLGIEFPREQRRRVSHQTIYTWIRSQQAAGRKWQGYLRRLGRKRPEEDKRGRLPASVSIEGRPAVVDRRSRFGDWEGDTIVGANRRGGAVTLVDRKSGYLLLSKIRDLRAPTVCQAAARKYQAIPAALRKTLTLDNGKEFADHEQLASEAALKVYFAKPYSAWQRGTNENEPVGIFVSAGQGTSFAG